MDHLTVTDAGLLYTEDANRRVSCAGGALVVLEGPMPDFESLMATFGQRIALCPRFAQRLRVHALDYDAPEWVDDADFDLTHHVKRVALPSPGDDHELHRLVAEVMAWRLDRSRPLWELWIVEGLDDDRWAMLLKVHHCIGNAAVIAHIVTGLADDAPANIVAPQPDSARQSGLSPWDLNPIPWLSGVVRGAVKLLQPSEPTPLHGPVSNLRRFSAASASLADIRQVCDVFDVTPTAVALAALTDSYRKYLIRSGLQPSQDMLPLLPIEEENPVQQLRVVHARLRDAEPKPSGFGSMINQVPFPVTAWALRLLARLPHGGGTPLAANVTGRGEALQVMGLRVTAVIPIPPITTGLRTSVSVHRYADDLYFGILTDFEAVPDVDTLARGVEAAVRRLVASSKRRKPARDHKGLTLVVSA